MSTNRRRSAGKVLARRWGVSDLSRICGWADITNVMPVDGGITGKGTQKKMVLDRELSGREY